MKRINKKKFYPCKQDYQELEDCIIGISEIVEKIMKDPTTLFDIPAPFIIFPEPYHLVAYPDLPIVWTSTSGTTIKIMSD